MEYDKDKVDEMTLALMYLVMTKKPGGGQAWKAFDLQTLERLRNKGWITEMKAKSITLEISPEGVARSEELFRKHFQRN